MNAETFFGLDGERKRVEDDEQMLFAIEREKGEDPMPISLHVMTCFGTIPFFGGSTIFHSLFHDFISDVLMPLAFHLFSAF